MTGEREIDYEGLVQDAMRGVVRSVLTRVAKTGLPGDHHFYIAFRTDAPGVSLSPRLKEKYPEEMTVVLQHRFWDLAVRDTSFEVKLTFDGIPERLVVPIAAIKVFFDPSVPYGLQFEESDLAGGGADEAGTVQADDKERGATVAKPENAGARSPAGERTDKKPRTTRRARSEKSEEPATAAPGPKPLAKQAPKVIEPVPAANQDKVVSLDKFRKK